MPYARVGDIPLGIPLGGMAQDPSTGKWYTNMPLFGITETGPPGSTSGGFSGWMSQQMPKIMNPTVAAAVIGGVATVMTGGIAAAAIPALVGSGTAIGAIAAPFVGGALSQIPDSISSLITGGQGGAATPAPLEGLHSEVATQSQPPSVPTGILVGTGYHGRQQMRVRRLRRRRY